MKSQMELMGLAIVVILLSIVFLFVIRFVVLREQSDVSKDFAESELAANFLNTLLDTHAPECADIKFSTLFQDCASSAPGRIECDGQYSCDYLRDQTSYLFERTFDEWKMQYYFIAYADPNNPTDTLIDDLTLGEECKGNRKVKIQPLPLEPPDNVYLALYICE